MSIHQIIFLQDDIEEKWKIMQEQTKFYYDDRSALFKRRSSIFGLKKKENTNRLPKDLPFWEKVDNYVLDVKRPLFPLYINHNHNDKEITFKFYGSPQAEEMRRDIETQKGLLAEVIADYNERIEPGSKTIQDKNDILEEKERLRTEKISRAITQVQEKTETNTVLVLVLCHGEYVVNDNLTIDRIPFPENKLGEIVKKSVFGKKTLSDYDFTSRYAGDKTSTRYSEALIKEKLQIAYFDLLSNTNNLTNILQQKNRKVVQQTILQDREAYCKEYGLPEESCTHVGFEFTHVPFLRKLYALDDPFSTDPTESSGFRRGEFGHGIIIMFQDNNKIICRNLNRFNDFLWLQQNEYIFPENLMRIVRHWGTADTDLDRTELAGLKRSELLITELDTALLMRVIGSFPEKYKFFKIVDNSCGVLRHLHRDLTPAEEEIVLQKYWADMQCSNPVGSKGGRRRRKRKSKTFKGNKSKKQQRKANKKRKTKKY
jgi:hypothetical protein